MSLKFVMYNNCTTINENVDVLDSYLNFLTKSPESWFLIVTYDKLVTYYAHCV